LSYEILVGDSLKEMRAYSPVDVVMTSPPYNLDIDYKEFEDNISREDYLIWVEEFAIAIKDTLADDGSFFLNMGFTNTDPWVAMDVANVVRKHFILQNQIAWIKSVAMDNVTKGHFKPIQSPRYINNTFEYVYHFTKTGDIPIDRLAIGVPYTDKYNAQRWDKDDLHCRGNSWFIPYETILREPSTGMKVTKQASHWLTVTEASEITKVNKAIISMAVDSGKLASNGMTRRERRIDAEDLQRWNTERHTVKKLDHPAIYPWELVEMCIKLHGVKPGMKVLDPCLGTGSTLVATEKLGVHGIGIERVADYAAMAQRRLKGEKWT